MAKCKPMLKRSLKALNTVASLREIIVEHIVEHISNAGELLGEVTKGLH